jgi:LCP family protein required for cell wall assembly
MQPPPPRRSAFAVVRRVLLVVVLLAVAIGAGVGGGLYLYFHQSVSAVQAHSKGVVRAEKSLDAVPPADKAAIALVIGYDHRANEAKGTPSLSDTLMLIRADPVTKTISLLSFPRDLEVPIYCGTTPSGTDRINSAYSRCGEKGTVLTIKHLTGLPINYLITVNFHGFKEVVNKLGGVWMDVDRRYYNKNVGTAATNFANINLQPGYQRLDGEQALDFVRFRHTDSDLVRVARQQEFVQAFKDQVANNFSITKVPGIVSAITHNVEVGEGGKRLVGGSQVLSYAKFAFQLPHGHLFQDRFSDVVCNITCTAAQSDIDAAVQQFTNPDVSSAKTANEVALGKKIKPKTLPPSKVTLTVLNGNGQPGAAANTSYLLAQRGYRTMVPPNNLDANLPNNGHVFHTKIYYDPNQAGARSAAKALQQVMQPADVEQLPRTPSLLALDPGSMLMVVVGTAFGGSIAELPQKQVPKRQIPNVRADSAPGHELLDGLVKKVPFKLQLPTVLEKSSYPDEQYGDTPVRLYTIAGHHKAVRMVFRMGGGQYWGIEETDWNDAPALHDKSFQHDLGGREFDLYYSGSQLHMIVLRADGATYWVMNTLLNDLSNETMLHIAQGLKPLATAK